MAEISFVNDNEIILQGSWSLENVVDLHGELAKCLAGLRERKVPQVGIDLSGVSRLDACGCQLLTLFMKNLAQEGVSIAPCGLDQLTDQIALLGFAGEFTAPRKDSDR